MSGQFGSSPFSFGGNVVNTTQTPLFAAPTPIPYNATPGPGHKRRASSPPPNPSPSNWSTPHEHKRRRPNLQNGFATMSISPRPDEDGSASATRQQHAQAQNWSTHVDDESPDDDELEPTRPPADGDVAVEVLSDKHHSPTQPRRPSFPHRHSSFSSTSPSEEDYESDATFRLPQERARLRQAQSAAMQPTSVEHPEHPAPSPSHQPGTPTVEPFESPLKRKHLQLEDDLRTSKRQKGFMDMDGDLDMDPAPPVASGPGWYEPEKDRIVVTSLESPVSSPGRSPSPDPGPRRAYSYEENKKLSQPGDTGFTISPSLLTHLMAAQSDHFRNESTSFNPERGLVLYRPLGIPGAENVVKQWDPSQSMSLDDEGRFEEVNDDDDDIEAPLVGVPMDMGGTQWGAGNGRGWGGGAQPSWGTGSSDAGGEDEAMDIE